MKITLAQINPHPGNISYNCRKICDYIRKATDEGSDLIVFPELCVTGYPPMDLLESQRFLSISDEAVSLIAAECTSIAAIIGAPTKNDKPKGKRLLNSALFLANGKTINTVSKALLPTYDVFDEYRYFEPADNFITIRWKDRNIAITICEDLWDEQPFNHKKGDVSLYKTSPMEELNRLNPNLVINISAAPFAHNKLTIREEIFRNKALKYRIPVIMVNQTGANTDLVFDGASLVIDSNGTVKARLPFFREASLTFSTDKTDDMGHREITPVPGKSELIHEAVVTGLRDYLSKTGQKKVLIGLSGGIDSAVCAALAVEAVGCENVTGLMMPSRYSSDHSFTDAVKLAENLQIKWEKIEIEKPHKGFEEVLQPLFKGSKSDTTEENIQARIRAILLMAYSNKFGYLVLNTSNKSEAATGYGTLYGDMAGAISPLGDIYKTDVYRIARHINRNKEIIPENSITKAPTAELKEDQKDTDSLPPYEILDEILFRYIELVRDQQSIIDEGFNEQMVKRIIKMVNSNEYKRFQAPPSIRVSSKAFGSGRRIPLVSGFSF
jgi:NAD+ synthase (glutamine-hydrolysing)